MPRTPSKTPRPKPTAKAGPELRKLGAAKLKADAAAAAATDKLGDELLAAYTHGVGVADAARTAGISREYAWTLIGRAQKRHYARITEAAS